MVADPWYINAVDVGGGVLEPAYAAAELRRAYATLLFPGVADPTGARQGIRPGHTAVSVAGTTWTVHDLVAVVYPALTSVSGPYLVQELEQSGSLDPADLSDARIDALDLQIQDDDEDASGERRSRVVYVVGTPAGTPSPPAVTANSLRLATIDVPQDGTGSPSVTVTAQFTVASGGVLPVRETSELPSSGLYDGMAAWDSGARELLVREVGGWSNVRHEEVRAETPGPDPGNLGATETTVAVVALTIPGHWNTWDVEWTFTFNTFGGAASAARTLTLRVRHGGVGGTQLSEDHIHTLTLDVTRDLLTVAGGAQGLTGTGAQSIRLTGILATNDDYVHDNRQSHARAIRTS